jgi:hypothetical protein
LDIGKLGKATPIADVPFAKQNNTKKLQHKKKNKKFSKGKAEKLSKQPNFKTSTGR